MTDHAESPKGAGSHTLVLLRHSKADRSDGVSDHRRPLTSRGQRDAEAAGRWMATTGLVPDLVLCSDAVRARQTWESVAVGLVAALPDDVTVRYDERLYEASAPSVVSLVAETAEDVGTVLVVGHEPAMSAVAVALAGPDSDGALVAEVRAHLPTSGVVVLRAEGGWADLQAGTCALTALQAPRG